MSEHKAMITIVTDNTGTMCKDGRKFCPCSGFEGRCLAFAVRRSISDTGDWLRCNECKEAVVEAAGMLVRLTRREVQS
jgi:hypothetical protein